MNHLTRLVSTGLRVSSARTGIMEALDKELLSSLDDKVGDRP
jgi:hypothetical protein